MEEEEDLLGEYVEAVSDEEDILEAEQLCLDEDDEEYCPSSDEDISSDDDDQARLIFLRRYSASHPGSNPGSVENDNESTPCMSTSRVPVSSGRGTSRTRSQSAPVGGSRIEFEENVLKGRNLHSWTTKSSASRVRTSKENLRRSAFSGPTYPGSEVLDAEGCFHLFIDENLLLQVVAWTNQRIASERVQYSFQNATNGPISFMELKALIGLMVYSSAQNDNHLSVKEMWAEDANPVYKATMSARRFQFLLRCLRFDDSTTREERKKTDKFAPIRRIWDLFVEKCQLHYIPGDNITVDEQLLGFRGRCSFRMYIANKPAKYGLKIIMACDASSKYMLNALPYLGKGTMANGTMGLAQYAVTSLVQDYENSGRNITTDNWFTSIALANDLLGRGLTIVGTLRKNKPEIPQEMLASQGRQAQSSAFCYDGKKTMVSYMSRSKKLVLLLSTMHSQPVINEVSGKPDIVMFYNKTKGGVDSFDQMCSHHSCSRKTGRWPLCIFFGLLNAACVNSWVIFRENNQKAQRKVGSRRQYMKDLAFQLITPWMTDRLKTPSLRFKLREIICGLLHCEIDLPRNAATMLKRKRCYTCPRHRERKSQRCCETCGKSICKEHSKVMCHSCFESR